MTDTPPEQGNNRNPDGTFKPGASGNPEGRPKGSYSIMTLIRKKMEEVPIGQTKEWKEQFADMILELAVVNKNERMIEMVVKYMDGLPNQKIDFGVDKENIGELTDFLQVIAKKAATPPTDENAQHSEPVREGAK